MQLAELEPRVCEYFKQDVVEESRGCIVRPVDEARIREFDLNVLKERQKASTTQAWCAGIKEPSANQAFFGVDYIWIENNTALAILAYVQPGTWVLKDESDLGAGFNLGGSMGGANIGGNISRHEHFVLHQDGFSAQLVEPRQHVPFQVSPGAEAKVTVLRDQTSAYGVNVRVPGGKVLEVPNTSNSFLLATVQAAKDISR